MEKLIKASISGAYLINKWKTALLNMIAFYHIFILMTIK